MINVLLSHKIRIHNITLESEIIMIGMLLSYDTDSQHHTREIILIGVLLSHEIWIHNITLENVSIMIGVLLEGKKSNKRAVHCLSIFIVHVTLANFVIG